MHVMLRPRKVFILPQTGSLVGFWNGYPRRHCTVYMLHPLGHSRVIRGPCSDALFQCVIHTSRSSSSGLCCQKLRRFWPYVSSGRVSRPPQRIIRSFWASGRRVTLFIKFESATCRMFTRSQDRAPPPNYLLERCLDN
jgi:hypothetical protein